MPRGYMYIGLPWIYHNTMSLRSGQACTSIHRFLNLKCSLRNFERGQLYVYACTSKFV